MKIDIVIGANFGDEGKGLITDFYASQTPSSCLVVRHNGGAQAGHTVTTPDGTRHVFSQFGAGTLAGAATYLSRFFVCNPFLFRKERMLLAQHCALPALYADRRGLVSTPYDMMINQIVEETRGAQRHGSCGLGFGETIERNLHAAYAFTVGDMADLQQFLRKLVAIRTEWLPKRLVTLGVCKLSKEWQERIESDDIMADFIDASALFLREALLVDALPQNGLTHIVCEGAQGLLLDQDHAWFPHVTRSYTGIRNAVDVLQEGGINAAHVTYVTRSYLTRHGAGPLPRELARKPYENIVDTTNITNAYQEHLRFSYLDVDAVAAAIADDMGHVPKGFMMTKGLAVTCLDQLDAQACFIADEKMYRTDAATFVAQLYTRTGAAFGLQSFGPTRGHVKLTSETTDHRLAQTG